jgi:molybdate transport system substrate-binding protein
LSSENAGQGRLKVLSGNGPRAAVRELCKEFEHATGNTVDLQFEVNPDVVRKAQAGEPFDVAVGNPHTIDRLIECGKAVPGSRVDFGRSGLAAAVKSGAPKPDIATVDAFKRTLLALRAVAFPAEGASGVYFLGLLDRMGIKDRMERKLKPMKAEDCVEVVARGEAEMVVVVATRMMGVAGVDIVGPLPEDLQTKIGFSAGLSAGTRQPDAARALIRFLSAPSAAATLKKNGVEPC